MVSNKKKIQHLYSRAGFGITPSELKKIESKPINQIIDDIFNQSKKISLLTYLPIPETKENGEVSNFNIIVMIVKSQEQLKELNLSWIEKMTSNNNPLLERLTFFWHNHFATSVPFAYLMQQQNNTIRKFALGKFSDLLFAIAKDPAMIIYLNNQQNKKTAPNENFAREVMELFTLGEGKYSEKDIKEAARAFTGWNSNKKGEFEFIAKDHDDTEKEFLGKKGNFDGDDILKIILEQEQTAYFIAKKIYKEFVNEKVNESRINDLAIEFKKSDYNIETVFRKIFTSDWFYEEQNIGSKISAPIDLIVRLKRLTKFSFEDEKNQIQLQRVLGQILFFPPNVAGWKGGKNWIDATSLLQRLNLPSAILQGTQEALKGKPQFEEKPEFTVNKNVTVKINSDWTPLMNHYKSINESKWKSEMIEDILLAPSERVVINEPLNEKFTSTDKCKYYLLQIFSSPEFQLI
jgi:uncharacterized protein (DUF1800 family)